jgi:hypothetical protein
MMIVKFKSFTVYSKSMTSQVQMARLVTVPEYGELVPRVLFRGHNFIVENWLPGRKGLEQYLVEKFGVPSGVSALGPSEVATLWRMLEGKRNKDLESVYQEMKKYAIRTGAIGVIEDRKNLVYNTCFDSDNLPVIILNPQIQTPNQQYAKELDQIVIKKINDNRDPTLDDLVKTKAKFVGGKVYSWPQILTESHSECLSEDIAFLGATKANFPSGIRNYANMDPDYGDGYRAVRWGLCPADEGSSELDLYYALEDSGSAWGSLQGRRSADSGVFYRNQLIGLQSKIKNTKEKLAKVESDLTGQLSDIAKSL